MPVENNDRDTRNLSEAEKKQVHRNRMDRPPYSLADDSKPFNRIYEGSCFCKKVKFEVAREAPLDAKYCHCKGCQQLHGAPFQWAAIFHKEDVHIYEGQDQLIYWNSPEQSTEYILPCKVYCNHCRAPIMDEGRNMILLFPTLIHFKNAEEKQKFRPSCHIFYSRRCIDVPDGIPKWEDHKDKSKRIPETFEEEKKAYEEGKISHRHDDREHMD